MLSSVLLSLTPMYFIIGIIFYLRKKNIVSVKLSDNIAPVIFRLLVPSLVFTIVSGTNFTKNSIVVIVIAIFVSLSSFLLFKSIGKKLFSSESTRKSILISGFSFYVGAIVYPFVNAVGSISTSVLGNIIITDITLFLIFLIMTPVIAVKEKVNITEILKNQIKDPIIIAVLLAVIVSIWGIKVPEIIVNMISFVVSGFGFVASVYVGLILEIPTVKQLKKVGNIVFLRYLLIFIVSIIVWNTNLLPLNIKQGIILVIWSPMGDMAAMFGKKYKLDPSISIQLSVVTVLISLVIYPILFSMII